MPPQERVEVLSAGESIRARYQTYGQLAVVRGLAGYDDSSNSRTPVWGDRLGVYHPVTSEITSLDTAAWQVLDAISGVDISDDLDSGSVESIPAAVLRP